jgi:hypothetical protein
LEPKSRHEELITTLDDDAYHLSSKDYSRPRRTVSTFGSQLEAFFLHYPFASVRVIAQHIYTRAPTIKDFLHKEPGMRKTSRRWVPRLLREAPKAARAEASREMLRILQDSEEKDFEGIVTSDESWFRCLSACSKMFARSPAEVTPRIR